MKRIQPDNGRPGRVEPPLGRLREAITSFALSPADAHTTQTPTTTMAQKSQADAGFNLSNNEDFTFFDQYVDPAWPSSGFEQVQA
ncbi:5490_t:CDS:2, partial [Acaulospora colombiana]